MKLHFRKLGAGSPLIILHGVFGSSDNWLTVAKELADIRTVYLVDLRNHGQSEHSADFTYDDMAGDIKSFIGQEISGKTDLIGHSMGGKVVMKLASTDPELINKMIVVDISPRYYRKHHEEILGGLNAIDLDALTSRQEADSLLSKQIKDLPVRQFLLKNLYRSEENKFKWRINLPVITEKIENIGKALEEETRIDIPTLFVRGSESRYIMEKDEVLINSIFSKAKINTISGAGHWVQAEKPQEFVALVKGFLA